MITHQELDALAGMVEEFRKGQTKTLIFLADVEKTIDAVRPLLHSDGSNHPTKEKEMDLLDVTQKVVRQLKGLSLKQAGKVLDLAREHLEFAEEAKTGTLSHATVSAEDAAQAEVPLDSDGNPQTVQ